MRIWEFHIDYTQRKGAEGAEFAKEKMRHVEPGLSALKMVRRRGMTKTHNFSLLSG